MFDFTLGVAFGYASAPLFKKYVWPTLQPKLAALWAKVV